MITTPAGKGLNDLISVIVVTYNAAETLQQCLDSIYAQTYPAIEVILIDGQSTDATTAIIKLNAPHLAYSISEKDTGIYNAMNKALKQVKGKWVYFLGADDELLPGFSTMAGELVDDTAIYYANVTTNGIIRSGQVTAYYMAKVGIYHQAIIYPAKIFSKYTFNEKYKIAADFALNMRCYRDKEFHFEYKPYIIAKYNHTGISAVVVDTSFEKDKPALIRRNFGVKIWLRYMFRLLKAGLNVNKKG